MYQRWSRLTDPLAYARRTAINATRADWRRSMRADRAHRETARLPATTADDPQERFVTKRPARVTQLREDGLHPVGTERRAHELHDHRSRLAGVPL